MSEILYYTDFYHEMEIVGIEIKKMYKKRDLDFF
jgi:hypothetical protein